VRGVFPGSHLAVHQVGDAAPDFDLPALIGGVKKRFHLSEQCAKKTLVLAFYLLNWEPLSTNQMVQYQMEREKFTELDAEVVGISVDSIMNTSAWEREIGPFDYPLCSDFWPHREVSRTYGVFREQELYAGASERAIFIVNRRGTIVFRKIYEVDQVPAIGETLDALRRL
jgi:peroxiredoxin